MQSETRKPLEKVELHSLVLFNVSDHIVRGSEGKFGVLLGVDDGNQIVVHTSFETLVVASTIDQEYLQRRLDQFRTVNPAYHIVGIYNINNSTSLNSLTISIVEQTKQCIGINGALICSVFDSNELRSKESTAAFQSYLLGTLEPLKTVVRTNESEFIATTTAVNHQEYSGSTAADEGPSNVEHKENMAMTVNQLNEKVLKVIQYLETSSEAKTTEDSAKRNEINRLVVHLSNKLDTIKRMGSDRSNADQVTLQTAQLSLLTEQLTILDNLKAQITKHVVWHGLTNNNTRI
ncbi:uncharacterized protein CANTADRAFT_25590 [Suhomyces tanzawaensis NRRL Y-17324]|uniref:MPN domain-containing protein n=1 Tax=Suhomyces tanzawaensis NRRL Y-17324 TaxID=984487 RepID=A0A1E4SJL4_9ASCO|nr:uncharacterized protein CANTADRAFT_25590 [Suhomyces tanzawaensis NRRL Y-17324]ODV79696.1 hypothetical protein CANTADRAFT_25590 [Suhomyces tanzawaensis NRRL Y-17324]